MLYFQLLLFGVGIGVISGMLGIGGGIILVPGLMLLFGFTQQEAQGTSLAALIPQIGIFAAMVYWQHGFVRIPVAAAVAAGFMIGAYGGALVVPRISVDWLRLGFGALLLYLGCSFVFVGFPPKTFSAAALPAGLAAVLAAIGAWLRGKRIPSRMKLPPPDGQTEYHI
ncbi:MAG: sulfite exporter TauE/SafE family protein [Planctomycetia bacterium]|nr:sulfite exporter TauE/SafE family protein [Planctomycetia bacterium]